ncbi:MAG: hypothetical protein QOE60_2186 [Thermoleophilaceae bacterium]|nr:hypothetical protein [Thermoleophilaceae bacterium]
MAISTDERVGSSAREFLARSHGLFIDGNFVDPIQGETFETLDPATGEALATIAHASAEDVDAAVKAARAAFEGPWADVLPADRSRLLNRLADLVEDAADELAELESLDTGKPLTYARAVDLDLTLKHLRYYAGWPTKIVGDVVPVSVPDRLCYTLKEPVGVCGLIVPWNFPLLVAAWKLAPALAAGCTVVLKPAEETPLTALRLAELVQEAGIPDGVVNVLTGDGSTGAAVVDHPGIDKVSFTGSTEVGREIGSKAGRALKRVTLELGGKSPNIILPDADIDAAVAGSFLALYFNTGQACNAGSRLFVHSDQYDDVVSRLADTARATVPSSGLEPETQLGPLVSARQKERVMGYIDKGVEEGAELVVGGHAMERDGYFVEPTLFTTDRDDLAITREEIFGPVLVALPYEDIDEVARRANDTDYGLAAGVWTTNMSSAHRLARRLKAGSIYINTWSPSDAAAPFGGFKSSGIGREMGREGLDPYLEHKTVWVNVEESS